MKPKIISLWNKSDIKSSLTIYPETEDRSPRAAILVVPGGGYHCVCHSTEGFPVAERFSKLGFRTFILDYRVCPNSYPDPQNDIFRAIRLIRYNAKKWNVLPDQIAVCGFSAGGHLSACAGIFGDCFPVEPVDAADKCSSKPNAMLLCYPVITAGKFAHQGSFQNLLGTEYKTRKNEFSLEKRVSSTTVPAFIWHTLEDPVVPVENSILLSKALRKYGVKHELHLFPSGPHGMQLGYGRADISQWPEQAAAFLCGSCGFRRSPQAESSVQRKVVLTFGGGWKSHLKTVAPILNNYGFHATFFAESLSGNPEEDFLSVKEWKKLSSMGFEIGAALPDSPAESSAKKAEQELAALMQSFSKAKLPSPVSFSHPGGQYRKTLVPILKKYGFLGAGTLETSPWETLHCRDLYRIPSALIHYDAELLFYVAVGDADGKEIPVLAFHGIPDPARADRSCSEGFFKKVMRYLYDNGYQVLSMKEFLEEKNI